VTADHRDATAAEPKSTGAHRAGRCPHRAVVAATVVLVVLLATGITAAIRPATGSAHGAVTLSSTMTPLADGGTTGNYTNGITLTLAPGWTIMNSNKGGIWARNSGNTASIEIDTGHPHAPDINGDLAWLISADIDANGYTNVVQQPSAGGVQTVQGKHFTQQLMVDYTANQQLLIGTKQLFGIWMGLFNLSTQQDAFIDLRAPSVEDLGLAIPDAKRMIGSIL
jgi:hypothetical protein